MTFPSILAEHLKTEGTKPPVSSIFSLHAPCTGAKHHSPTPLVVRTVVLDPERRTDVAAPTATLCGTCADNVGVLMGLMHHHDGVVPWAVRRDFGNLIRALAQRGWEWYSTGVAA